MTKDEAMKQAKILVTVLLTDDVITKQEAEILRQALEQPECADCNGMGFVDGVGERCQKCAGEGVEQPEQEPVAWGFQNTAITGSNRWMYLRETIPTNDPYRGVLWTPLYTAPPKREWVGLTDEKISQLWDGHVVPVFGKNGINPIVFARAIEAMLKEKNNL